MCIDWKNKLGPKPIIPSERREQKNKDTHPVFSKNPQVAAIELVDSAYNIVELYDAKSPYQKEWKQRWLEKARELGI
jgi:hypothetical protein